MTTNPVRVLERLTLTAPLGVAFHDTVTRLRVAAGLDATVYAKTNPARRAKLFVNPSGIYALSRAPGLSREFEFGAGDEEFWERWSSTAAQQPYVLEVVDLLDRFQPFSLEIDLPRRGVFDWISPIETSPPESLAPASIPLYSAPARRVPPGMAVVRAELLDTERDAPAAWALVEARYEDRLIARGMSDAGGRLALIFPYPAPAMSAITSPAESPPAMRSPPLDRQKWDVTISAGYAGREAASSVPSMPDLRAALEQLRDAPARLWEDREGGAELTRIQLQYGRELVLKTQGPDSSSPPSPRSALLITPAGSPP
jgi:hypothetical protein